MKIKKIKRYYIWKHFFKLALILNKKEHILNSYRILTNIKNNETNRMV